MESSLKGPKKTLGWAPEASRKSARQLSNNYVARHWRGDLSLLVSYWVNGLIVSIVWWGFYYVVDIFYGIEPIAIDVEDISFVVFMVFILVTIAIYIWQIVGVWRAAGFSIHRGGSEFWAMAAKYSIAFGDASILFGMPG